MGGACSADSDTGLDDANMLRDVDVVLKEKTKSPSGKPSPNRLTTMLGVDDSEFYGDGEDLDGSSSDSDEAEVFGPRHERNYVDPANIPDDPLAYLIIPKELDEHEFEFVFEEPPNEQIAHIVVRETEFRDKEAQQEQTVVDRHDAVWSPVPYEPLGYIIYNSKAAKAARHKDRVESRQRLLVSRMASAVEL